MKTKIHVLAALMSLALTTQACAEDAAASLPFRDPALSVDLRAQDLVSRMTLEEKAHQLGHTAPAIPRLGVPEYNWWNEGLHGVARAGIATVFPQAIGLAATWDTKLIHKTADVISTEFRAKYVEHVHPSGGTDWYRGLTVWSPNVNIFRDPRWGRGQETYGEDPYLTSQIGIAFVKGLQGEDPHYLKTVATPKHFAVHSGPESNRHKEDVHPSRHDLHDTYLPAFRATVMEGKAESIMCAYNAVDGVPACASDELMQKYLRESWGFKGFVVTDCGAAANIFREDSLHYKPNAAEGVAAGFKAGMDLICGDYRNRMSTEPEGIVQAVKEGLLPQAVIDQSLRRLFEARIRLGMFDPPNSGPYSKITAKDNDTAAHRQVSLDVAKASMVLLKNTNDFLPLKRAPATIAVVGPNADSVDALIGNYAGTPSAPVTVLAGIRARFPQSKVIYAEGTGLIGPVTSRVPETVFCVDTECKTRGVKADSYGPFTGRPSMEGPPASTHTDPSVSISWKDQARQGAIRWTGTIVVPESGEYRFGYVSHGGARIWVNDQQVVDDWSWHDAPSMVTGAITLQADRKYPIKVEAFQFGQEGEQHLVWSVPSQRGDDAVEAARQADLVVFVGGLSARVEGEEMKVNAPGFAGGDRTSIDLPGPQRKLLERVHATGKPVVLVLMNGSALSVNWADQYLPAIVEAWYPGGEGGTAVASLLAGDYSPAGRLPVTFYKSADQLPAFNDYSMAGRTYRYFSGGPLYPFGHGLSYTTFKYENARVSRSKIKADDEVTVSVEVTNTGKMASDEVVQLYLSHDDVKGAPIRSLQSFERISLQPSEKKLVQFKLRDRAFSIVDEQGIRRIQPGKVNVWLGGGQPATRKDAPAIAGANTQFTLTSGAILPN